MKFKTLISSVALIAGMSAMAPTASAIDWSASADYTSEYNFRGITLGADSIQVGIEGAVGDFYFGGWASSGFGEAGTLFDDELDLYAGYGFTLSDLVSADVGATIYHYPQYGDLFDFGDEFTGVDDASTLELFAGLAFDVVLEPSVYAYYDTTLEAFTLEAGGAYSWPVSDMVSFDLSGTLGTVQPDEGDDWTYAMLGASLGYAVSEDTSAYVGLTAGTSSEDTFANVDDISDSDFGEAESSSVWFGAGVSTDF